MKMTLIPHTEIVNVWLSILPLVRKLIPRANGRTSELAIYEECLNGKLQLWIVFEETEDNRVLCFVCTRIRQYPKRTMLVYEYAAGAEINKWFGPLGEKIEAWARELGCDGAEIVGRMGWARKLKKEGWKPALIIAEKSLIKPEIKAEKEAEAA